MVRAERPAEALAPLETALRRRPSSADAQSAAGEAYYALGNGAKATESFRAALRAEPTDANAWAGLACALADAHQHAEAGGAARRAVQIAPDSGIAHAALGYVLSASGDTAEAVRALERAVTLDPQNGGAFGLLAAARASAARTPEDLQAAEAALARADALRPRSPMVPYYRGRVQESRGDYAAAARKYRQALERKTDFSDALYRLSLSLARAGQMKESADVRRRFESLHDYEREVNNLQLQLGRDQDNVLGWRRMADLAHAHGDMPRERLARERLVSLTTGGRDADTPR